MTKPRRSNRFETIITKANVADKQRRMKERPTFCSESGTRTRDLWIMSPTSYRLLYLAMLTNYKTEHRKLVCRSFSKKLPFLADCCGEERT